MVPPYSFDFYFALYILRINVLHVRRRRQWVPPMWSDFLYLRILLSCLDHHPSMANSRVLMVILLMLESIVLLVVNHAESFRPLITVPRN